MSMDFTVTLTGDIEADVEASDLGLDLEGLNTSPNEWFDAPSSVEVFDVHAYGEVTLAATARIEDLHVGVADMAGYDAAMSLEEALNSHYGGVKVQNADFEVTGSPIGFNVVEAIAGKDDAINIYAALAEAGYEVI